MELTKNYIPGDIEQKWYRHWLDKGYFNSVPDEREPYTIVIPPPNVTGFLHMGHSLNNTIQDILIRRARMQGKNACWVPGTDHASIATEAKVVGMLRERGIAKSSLARDEFLAHVWEWKEKYGGIILQQLKKLGCSPDWSRTTFTMDKDYYQSVIKVFVGLYDKGSIYRGKRMINWDVKAKTALSDEEVIRRETKQQLYHIRYRFSSPTLSEESGIVIATVRPETIMGDTAICVHPDDERYKHLIGLFALVPLINRRIPIIADEYVTMDFGTGALKVTPAHDINDNQLGQKHHLQTIDILNDDGTLSEAAEIFIGEDRFEARKKIVQRLQQEHYLVKVEDYASEVGYSERTDTVVEPRLSMQWWLKMKDISGPALNAVVNEEIKFYPAKYKNTYRYWMENIRDWCISRQLWWGHRIPAWYDDEGRYVVAENEARAKEKFIAKYLTSEVSLKQDEDCLDTWFSSWLWPFEVFKGLSNPGNEEVKYYYPTNTLVTAPEIIFFWVARMIMAGYEYMGEKPFSEVYFTGIVRDKVGRKMSKQLGNSPDLLALIDLYGADAVRFGIMVSSPAGNDLMFDESALEQGRNFNNKLWNALKLVKAVWKVADQGNVGDAGPQQQHRIPQPGYAAFAIGWFNNKLDDTKAELEKLFSEFRLSEALKTIYSLIWDDFCSWYLEWIKPEYGQPVDPGTYESTILFFEELMQLLHPYMPFITEEIYHLLRERNDDLCVRQLRTSTQADKKILEQGEILKTDITAIRDTRKKYEIKNIEKLRFTGSGATEGFYLKNEALFEILQKQTNTVYAEPLKTGENSEDGFINDVTVTSSASTFFLHLQKQIDRSLQKKDLLKDLQHQKTFLQTVQKKLNNERFVQNARPEVIELERKKQSDAEARIRTIEESLAALN